MFPILLLPLVFWLVVLSGGFYVAIRFIRAFETRGRGGDADAIEALGQRLLRLEETMEAMGTQLERVSEAQQFTTKLLTEKTEPPVN